MLVKATTRRHFGERLDELARQLFAPESVA